MEKNMKTYKPYVERTNMLGGEERVWVKT
jgi:hypothetical protein